MAFPRNKTVISEAEIYHSKVATMNIWNLLSIKVWLMLIYRSQIAELYSMHTSKWKLAEKIFDRNFYLYFIIFCRFCFSTNNFIQCQNVLHFRMEYL